VACQGPGKSLGISLERACASQVEEFIGQGQQAPSGHIPFTARAKKVLELSLREALQLGHNYIGTEHILLGLIREGEGVAAQVLVKLGAKLTRVRQQVIQLLQGYQGAPDQSWMRTEILDRMAKEVTEAIAKDVETIRGLSENIGKWGAQIDNLKALVMTSDSVVNGLAIRSITVLDEANPPVAMVEFSDGSQAVLREDHLRVIGYEAIQGKS
jgi:hypothetical protein